VRNTSTAAAISFVTTGITIANVSGDCIWADLNTDGKLDIIASGFTGADNFLTAFVNSGGRIHFTNSHFNRPRVKSRLG
jgi:hypothetical protein